MGERIRLAASDREAHLRSGDFATVERIADDHALSVRLDNGKLAELDADKARHIEYGYAVASGQRASVDRVLVMGTAEEPAGPQEILSHLAPHVRDVALYPVDSSAQIGTKPTPSLEQIVPSVSNILTPKLPEIELNRSASGSECRAIQSIALSLRQLSNCTLRENEMESL